MFKLKFKAPIAIPGEGLPVPLRYFAILTVGIGVGMSVIDGTIANVALPTIAHDLKTSPSTIIWVVNAYQLAITISLLSFSSFGEIFGYRKVFLGGVALFSITSLICAMADSFTTLTLARALQGFGAAAITSVNSALIRFSYPKKFLGRGLAINALVVAVSSVIGPTLAAGILSVATWHWLFAINVPIGLAAFFLGLRHLPANPIQTENRKFDITSAVMNAFTFGLMIISLDGIAHKEHRWFTICCVCLFAVIGILYIKRQLKLKYPLLPVDLLRIPIFSMSMIASIASFTAQMMAMIALPFFFQETLGRSDVTTGLLLTPWPLTVMIFAPIAGRLIEKIHPGLLGGFGMFFFSIGLLLLATMPSHPTNIEIIWRLIICGFGFGIFQTPNNSIIIASAPAARSGGANGMQGTARLLGQTLGATLVSLIYSMVQNNSSRVCLQIGIVFAVIACIASCFRLSQPSPLKHKKTA